MDSGHYLKGGQTVGQFHVLLTKERVFMKAHSGPNVLLKDIAYKKIKEGILEERYVPASFLSEKELIEDLNMSKTPIKAAIVRLEAEGFVKVSSKRGIIINDLTVEMINDIYDLRIALESFSCEQIFKRNSLEQLNELEKNLEEMKESVENLDVKKFADCDHTFHLMISQIAGNNEIKKILMNYYDHLFRITLKHLNKDPERMIKFYEDHRVILELLKAQDKSCVIAMKTHIEDSKRLLFQ
jgi:DNA-binding GntR family transcriptional regulator